MRSITALIDHTEISQKVIEFTKQIARHQGVKAHLLTVVPKGDNKRSEECRSRLTDYNKEFYEAGLDVELHMIEGSFFDIVEGAVDKLHTSLVIIGTHGKKGLKQHIFGSNILKLVQMLNVPSLVVQDSSEWHAGGFAKVLFPIAEHSQFEMKMQQTRELMDPNGMVELYTIYKTDRLNDETAENVTKCQGFFEAEGIKYRLVEEEAKIYSVGYARQTIAYAGESNPHLISIMAQAAGDTKVFGNVDKENVILNELGIAVLCCH